MSTREDLDGWIAEALEALPQRRGGIVEICEKVWAVHEADLRNSKDLFYTWQYDIRWAANRLRHRKVLKSVQMSPKGLWELA